MITIKEIKVEGYERVIEAQDPESGLHCYISVHSTRLGPALGGTRIYPYSSPAEALADALRLSKAMTYKSALAQDGLGGGKSVIIANAKTQKTQALLEGFGKALDSLHGLYICAEDVGSTPEDMEVIRTVSPYVACLPREHSSGDPSRFTAWGVLRGMKAAAKFKWNDVCLRGKKIAIQGVGAVGGKLANLLFWEGANLILSDVDHPLRHQLELLYGARVVDDIASVPCDIMAPCALGRFLTPETVSQLQCQVIAGSANNQLSEPHVDLLLRKKNILYAPDYVINAGGIINAAAEFDEGGYDPRIARDRVNAIYDTLLDIFKISHRTGEPTSALADALAEENLRNLVGRRQKPILFD